MDTRNESRVVRVDVRDDEARARLAAIVDSADDAIVGKTLDGIITSWNRAAESIFGYSAEEAIGQHISLIIPHDRRTEEDMVLARLRQGKRIEHFETVRCRKDGRLIEVSITVSPIRNAEGIIIGASKVARDITERRETELLRARLAAIVDSSDDAIVSKTLEGVITSWNRGAERIFGYTAAEAIGRHISLIVPEDRRGEEEQVLARLRRGGRVDHFETRRRTKDGREVPISLTVSPIRDGNGIVVGASKVARDITERLIIERQQVEQDHFQLLTRLVLAQEDERRRIARELHDQLGQQLTALRLTLEMLKQPSMEHSDVRVQVETLEALALQLDQDVAFRIWELRPSGLHNGLPAALTSHVSTWSKHFGIPAQLHASPSTEERLASDLETAMYRLAQEALNNVAKHSRATHVDIVLERSADFLSLIIEDNGVGFDLSSPETLAQGVGLIGMRERAALIGADLQVESTLGVGTTIIVRLPVVTGAGKTASI
jgi:PAS domain S-box-containing protein